MEYKRVGKKDANTENTETCSRRGNRRTRRKTSPPPSKRKSIHQTISWDTWVSKKPSKPNLPDIPKPSKLLLQQGFSEPCLVLVLQILQQAPCCICHSRLLPMLPSSTKMSLNTPKRCGKCLGYQPLNGVENGEGRVEEIPQASVQRKVGITISNSQCVWLGFFSLKHSSTFVGNEGIYKIGTESVSQSVQVGKTDCLMGVLWEGLTCEILARHSCLHLA